MFCIKCSTQLSEEAGFCWKCGAKASVPVQHSQAITTGDGTHAPIVGRPVPMPAQQSGMVITEGSNGDKDAGEQTPGNNSVADATIEREPPVEVSNASQLLAAIREATADRVIQLQSGNYVLSNALDIDKSLSLIGSGMDTTRIISSVPGHIIRYTGAGVLGLHGLALEYLGDVWSDVVVVTSGSIYFRRCSFEGGKSTANQKRGGSGIQLSGIVIGTIVHCKIVRNELFGISVREQAHPLLEANTCEDNGTGIGYSENAGGIARKNLCQNNQSKGIEVSGEAVPFLEANICQDNKGSGIFYSKNARGTARENQCRSNLLTGIKVTGQARPLLERNTCQKNAEVGISFQNNATGAARQNLCQDNKNYGISAQEEAQPVLEANVCLYNGVRGIAFIGKAKGIARRNNCYSNGTNDIYVEVNARPLLEANTTVAPPANSLPTPDVTKGHQENAYKTTRDPLPPEKSVGLALFLGFSLGPFGMFYATLEGALTMLFVDFTAGVLVIMNWENLFKSVNLTNFAVLIPASFLILYALFIAPAVWAGLAAAEYNNQQRARYSRNGL